MSHSYNNFYPGCRRHTFQSGDSRNPQFCGFLPVQTSQRNDAICKTLGRFEIRCYGWRQRTRPRDRLGLTRAQCIAVKYNCPPERLNPRLGAFRVVENFDEVWILVQCGSSFPFRNCSLCEPFGCCCCWRELKIRFDFAFNRWQLFLFFDKVSKLGTMSHFDGKETETCSAAASAWPYHRALIWNLVSVDGRTEKMLTWK